MKLVTALFALIGCAAMAADPQPERLKWFDEARFGMFIHWGVYSVPAGEWQGKPVGGIGEWIMKNGKIPVADYRAFAKDFTAAKYDPVTWAKLAKAAGMKYVVITSKHHDGFALYDSKVTDWDVMNSGAARDLLEPLAKAVRAEGLRFGLYYSQAQDWNHPGGGKYGGKGWDPAQDGDYDKYLSTIALPQVKEIVDGYHPDIIWWDTPVDMSKERVKPFADFMATHPEIINNNRLGQGFAGDTKTPEQHIPPRGYPGERFEVCMTMNDTWGFKKNDNHWKSTQQLIRNLSDISSKGGNFLLNVGPTCEGEIPAASVERLQQVGKWMDVNSEAIYATTASPFPRRLPWGRVTTRKDPAGPTTLYLHVWDWPANRQIVLPTLHDKPTSGKLLAGGAPVSFKSSDAGLIVELPEAATDPDVSVVRLDFAAPITISQPAFVEPNAQGGYEFAAVDADAHGGYTGTIQVRGIGNDTYLTDWRDPNWRLEYQLKPMDARKWTVSAEVATPNPAGLILAVGKNTVNAAVEATGPDLAWKRVDLGVIDLPKGETAFEIKGVKENWKGISIRKVWLTPVANP